MERECNFINREIVLCISQEGTCTMYNLILTTLFKFHESCHLECFPVVLENESQCFFGKAKKVTGSLTYASL